LVLERSLPMIKQGLAIEGKYEILDANLYYVEAARLSRNYQPGVYVPAWSVMVNPRYIEGEGIKKIEETWVDARTGQYLGKTNWQ